jgi:hypothetical protein
MRAYLLATTAAAALLAATSAHATDGTWQGPGAEWTAGTNWSSTPTVPDNTATFTNNGAPTGGNDLGHHIDQHDSVRAWSARLFIYPRQRDSLHHCWRRHRQRLFECPEFLRRARINVVVHQ